jgi:hypothetical protein
MPKINEKYLNINNHNKMNDNFYQNIQQSKSLNTKGKKGNKGQFNTYAMA